MNRLISIVVLSAGVFACDSDFGIEVTEDDISITKTSDSTTINLGASSLDISNEFASEVAEALLNGSEELYPEPEGTFTGWLHVRWKHVPEKKNPLHPKVLYKVYLDGVERTVTPRNRVYIDLSEEPRWVTGCVQIQATSELNYSDLSEASCYDFVSTALLLDE